MAASLTPETVRQRLVDLLHEIVDIPLEDITDDATIDGVLEMTSIAFVELQVALEGEYDVQLDPIEVVELNRFGDIARYVFDCIQETHA